MKLSVIKKSIITAACLALCVVLPMAFHAIPNGGSLLSPMHIPVLLCGLICGWQYGLLCGLAGPLLSSLITSMPPIAYLPPMLVELAAYGILAGLFYRVIRTKHLYADLTLSLMAAMVGGRLLAGAAKALIFARGNYSVMAWATSYFLSSWPAIVLHIALIPALIFALEKAHLIPERYCHD